MHLKNIFLEAKTLSILELFIRASILYFFLFGSSKIMGFRQPGILTPYNFLMAAGVSHIAAARMVSPKGRLVDAAGIIILYTLINLFISYLYTKAPTIVSQKPIILIKKGKPIKENLSKAKLTIDNMFSILRQNGVHSIQDVEYLIAESTGKFSVAINNNSLPITRKMMAIETPEEVLSQIIIYKGKVDEITLKKNGLNYEWIDHQLKLNNIDKIDSIYIGILTPRKDLYIIR
ncbi:YetF domain-containing protein [Clostridium sp. Cult2]|uniref:YetF domain-containing protein n=1 Tax=Clostridium sp. Cult2 TaxID=2079003 RepID=UPI001F43D174|nr:hypothetical protein [Clostridium sp. Cult2]